MRTADLASLLAPPLCVSCGRHAGRGEPLCAPCRSELRWLGPEPVRVGRVDAWAPLAYEGPARAVVGALKFRGALQLADAMAGQIVAADAAGGPARLLERASLVPVPLHPARRRRRGFNQAERLAHALGERTGLAVADCLERRGPSTRQVGRGRAERLAGIAGAVRVREGAVPGYRVVLVDDVVTTGATLAACAEALLRAGAGRVAAVAYARTPGR